MKCIVWTTADSGATAVFHPAPWARLVEAITVDGDVVAIDPPQPFDRFAHQYGTDDLNPVWAESEDEFVARLAVRAVPVAATNVAFVDQSAIPTDRAFREAWTLNEGAVSVDMGKARDKHRDDLRAARQPLFAHLDVAFMKALEQGDAERQAAVVAVKQALRDVTMVPEIEAAATADQLKTLGISDLLGWEAGQVDSELDRLAATPQVAVPG